MEAHHYTDTPVKTAAAVVNAGTCLEDANMEDNIFTHIGEAVQSVSILLHEMPKVYGLVLYG